MAVIKAVSSKAGIGHAMIMLLFFEEKIVVLYW